MKAFLIGYPVAVFIAGLCVIVGQFEYSEAFWPAWLQAIGSLVALAVAIGLAKYQQVHDAAKAIADAEKYQRDMTVLCYLYCNEFCNFLLHQKDWLRWEKPGVRFTIDERALEEFRVQFRDLPLHQFNNGLMRHILAFRSTVNEVQRKFNQEVDSQLRQEMTPERILAERRDWMHERLHRTNAIRHSIEWNLQRGGWLDPDGVYAATPKAFRSQAN